MSRTFHLLVVVAVVLPFTGTALAHNVHPAYLEVVEEAGGQLDVTWKVPLYKGEPLEISPVFPESFRNASSEETTPAAGAVVHRWKMVTGGGELAGSGISIRGLEATMTDVLVRIVLSDGSTHRVVLRPNEPSTVVPAAGSNPDAGGGLLKAALKKIDNWRLAVLLTGALALGLLPSARKKGALICAAALLAGSLAGYTLPRIPMAEAFTSGDKLTEEESTRVLHGLLLNTYRAFTHEVETAAYDQLALSVSGDLLHEVYLQNRDTMTMEEAEGARTVIDRLDIKEIESMEPGEGGGYAVTANWDVYGSVRHWGHEHYRLNTYRAELTLVPAGSYWKLSSVRILEEDRVI